MLEWLGASPVNHEEARHVLEQRLNRLFRVIDGFWEYAYRTNELYVSPSMREFLELPTDTAMTDKDWFKAYMTPDYVEVLQHAISVCESGKSDHFSIDCAFKKGAGGQVWGNLHGICQRGADGSPQVLSIIVTDIDRLKQVETVLHQERERAEAMSQAKSSFIANLNHELRTPLNGILGMTDLFQQTPVNGQQQHYLENVQMLARSLLTLVNDILDISKIAAGKLQLEYVETDLHALLRRIIDIQQPLLQSKGATVSLNLQIHPSVPKMVSVDPTRLQQVLINLINNAIKFTAEGFVTVNVKTIKSPQTPDKIMLYFEVIDTGIGIAQGNINNLFQDFTQAQVSIARHYGGTGLGLSICKRILSLMGGEIGVISEVGQGSTFWFQLPVEATAMTVVDPVVEAVVVTTPGAHQIVAPDTLNILVAEDNEINQEVIRGLIERMGHNNVVIAPNGAEAVKLYQSNAFDIILMDINMPVMDGMTATKSIRMWELQHNKSPVPIVAVTADTMSTTREDFINQGMTDALFKPIDKDKLGTILEGIRGSKSFSPTPMMEAPVTLPPQPVVQMINKAALNELIEALGPEKVGSLVQMYRKNARELIEKLKQHDLMDLHPPAHTLAGMSENLAFEQMGKLARQLIKANHEDRSKIPGLLEQLDLAYTQTMDQIQTIVKVED